MPDCGCLWFPEGHRLPARYGLGAAALRYAALGYAVLPLARGGKKPHAMLGDRGGVHRASADPGQITEWWSHDMAANIGAACGRASRLAVIDLDVKHGADGPGEFWRFLLDHGLSMKTDGHKRIPQAATPSGGTHLWLRVPSGAAVPDRPGILPGTDVKGDGGYVVAAPSMLLAQPLGRPGERGGGEIPVPYTWEAGCPHAAPAAPGWLLPWLAQAASTGTARRDPGPGGDLDGDLADAREHGARPGERNRVFYRLACSLYRRLGTGPEGAALVLEQVREVWDKTDTRGFGWPEVLVCLESARRYISRERAREDARNQEFLAWMSRRNTL